MSQSLTPQEAWDERSEDRDEKQEALIWVMVAMSAADREMTDAELHRIGSIVRELPAFEGFDDSALVRVAQSCAEKLSGEDGLDNVLASIAASLPAHLKETAYAMAVEVAAADLAVRQEELRLLALLRDALGLDRLVTAAIERGARARYQRARP